MSGTAEDAGASPTLVVEDLHNSFGNVEVLKGVHLDAREGDGFSCRAHPDPARAPFLRCINLLESSALETVTLHGEIIRMIPGKPGEPVPEDMNQVMRNLSDESSTMIVVTHEIGFANDVPNKVIFLRGSLIQAEGPPQQMFGSSVSDRLRQFLARSLH